MQPTTAPCRYAVQQDSANLRNTELAPAEWESFHTAARKLQQTFADLRTSKVNSAPSRYTTFTNGQGYDPVTYIVLQILTDEIEHEDDLQAVMEDFNVAAQRLKL